VRRYDFSVTMAVSRRRALASIGALAAWPVFARSHISRSRVSAVTDEIGKTQQDAIAAIEQYKLQLVELRRVPGSPKEFASLTEPELKHALTELAVAKIRVAILHASAITPQAIAAAVVVGAPKLCVLKADADSMQKNLAAIEQAKIQLLIGDGKLLGQFGSKSIGLDWDPVKAPDGYADAGKGRTTNVRVDIEQEAGWRKRFEALDRDGYGGGISLETALEHSDDALHDLLRLVDSL
jgi:hypothetical protein